MTLEAVMFAMSVPVTIIAIIQIYDRFLKR